MNPTGSTAPQSPRGGVDPTRHMVGDPYAEGPGNPAWQRTKQMLERVVAEEDARRRRN